MFQNLRTNKILWSLVCVLVLLAAAIGVIFRGIYIPVISAEILPSVLPQDLLTILVSIITLILINQTKETDIKKPIIILGVIASFFYLYGIYAIERVYNLAYFLYLGIFALSFWALVYSAASLKKDIVDKIKISTLMGKVSAYISIVIALLFNFLWIMQLMPLLLENNKIEFLYSIYILDLCFVMPTFIITAIMALLNKPLGFVLAPFMFIMGFFVIFPLSLGEIAKPYYGQVTNIGSMMMSFGLSAMFIVLAGLHLNKLSLDK